MNEKLFRHSMLRRALVLFLCIGTALSCSSCKKPLKMPDLPFLKKRGGVPNDVVIRIASNLHSNSGRSFYVVVRSVTEQEFVTDDYSKIAAMVFSKPLDPTVLKAFSIIPGVNVRLVVANDARNPIAVYCLFSDPGQQWKAIFSQPVKRSYKLTIGTNSIQQE